MNALKLIFASLTLCAAFTASAQTQTPRADQRQANQAARINQGIASGQLTPREAGRMQSRHAAAQSKINAAKADGVVTQGERKSINKAQNKTSRAIHKQKHDGQRRPR